MRRMRNTLSPVDWLTAKVSRPPQAGRLERRVRPEGQKGATGLGQERSPRKSAGPRKRRSTARMIAGSACYTSVGGQKGLKLFGTRPSAGISGCAHEAGDVTNVKVTGALPQRVRVDRPVRAHGPGPTSCARSHCRFSLDALANERPNGRSPMR